MAKKTSIGNDRYYLFTDDTGELSPRLYISSHGGYWKHFRSTIQVPSWTTLHFFGPHKQSLIDPSISNATSGLKVYESKLSGQTVVNYGLSKYQGSHSDGAETYPSIKEAVERNREMVKMFEAAPTDYQAKMKSTGLIYENFDVLTIRHRRFKSDPSLSDALTMLQNNYKYADIFCVFCRCPIFWPCDDYTAKKVV